MNNNLVFKYYKPTTYNIISAVIMLFTAGASGVLLYLIFNKYIAFSFIEIIFLIFGLAFLLLRYAGKHFKDKKGSFTFKPDGVILAYENKNEFLLYNDIDGISRESYTLPVDLGVVSGTTTNGNQYNITTADGGIYIFRVAHIEEKAYMKAIRKLEKKIFNTPRLIGLNTPSKYDNLSLKQREARFEREKPDTNYTLVKAIDILLQKTGLELIEEE